LVKYPKYATTVIGAHSVPNWYEALDRLVAVGQLSMGALADAQYRASQAAILDQDIAAIDVITGGEMHRRTHNRHSPPNATPRRTPRPRRRAPSAPRASSSSRTTRISGSMRARSCTSSAIACSRRRTAPTR
jgi:hypothetical protein